MAISDQLEQWLRGGGRQLGQILIEADWETDVFHLRHVEDAHRLPESLNPYNRPEEARELARYNAAGRYRPLKFANDLVHGWRLRLKGSGSLREALDYFYPASFGVWLAHCRGQLQVTPLRSTLNRQTGIYQITRFTTDDDARSVIEQLCSQCTRHRLWELNTHFAEKTDVIPEPPREISPLCPEACSIFIGECRKAVKKKRNAS